MNEANVREELENVRKNQPVWPGDTISHRTAGELVRRGWAKRNDRGYFILTDQAPNKMPNWYNLY